MKIDKSQKENKLKVVILTYILLFAILYGVCNTNIYYSSLVPFGIGIVFSLLIVKFNGYYLSIVYVVAYVLANMRIVSVFESINVVMVLCCLQYLISRKNFKLKKWHVFASAIISEIVYIVVNIGNVRDNLALFVSLVLGLMFLYSNMCFFNATLNRGMMIKLNLDEKICGSVLLIIFMVGMSNCYISIVGLGLVIATIIILVSTYVSTASITIVISSLIGVSFAITTANPIYIAMFVVMALSAIAFKCNFKYLSMIAVIIGYLIFAVFFGMGITYGEVIGVVSGGVLFAFVPLKLINSIGCIFNVKSQVIFKNILSKNKKHIMHRIEDLSKVFAEMDRVYRGMIRGVLSDDKAIDMLKGELISSVCNSCPNKDRCYRESCFLDNSIDTILSIAYEKGKVLLIDLPAYLTSNCIKINQLINTLNSMIVSYKEYTGVVSNLDMSRLLIADQLNGVSKLLLSLSKEMDTNITFDSVFESRIKEELSYKNIICLECAIYEKDINEKFVNIIVKTDTINNKLIEKIVSKIINNKLMIVSIEPSEIIGSSIVTLKTRPNYDIAFGSSSINKMGKLVSGDTKTLVKLDDGKFMVSICDGMGSGESAHNISKLTITLIENFYRAGFDNDIIISSVNKLLSLTEEELFSTIDLCIIDSTKNIYDFIKLGATSGYLKRHRGECEEIKSNGLPVGVLEEIRPHITKKLINPFDMLVFVSDGVSDSFENKCDLGTFILNQDTINPQTLSEEILEKALVLNDNIAKDDMTVVCVRVFDSI